MALLLTDDTNSIRTQFAALSAKMPAQEIARYDAATFAVFEQRIANVSDSRNFIHQSVNEELHTAVAKRGRRGSLGSTQKQPQPCP